MNLGLFHPSFSGGGPAQTSSLRGQDCCRTRSMCVRHCDHCPDRKYCRRRGTVHSACAPGPSPGRHCLPRGLHPDGRGDGGRDPCRLVANGPVAALIVVAIAIGINQLDGHILQLIVMGQSLHLHGLVIFLTLAAGVIFAGIIGAVLAVPLAAVTYAIIQVWTQPVPAAGPDAAKGEWPAPDPAEAAGHRAQGSCWIKFQADPAEH